MPPRSRLFGLALIASSLALLFTSGGLPAQDSPRPNLIVMLCDDLGYGDLECYGHPHIRTPNLNRLAEEGIRFTRFYSPSPVCSPSRVGLLTGQTPNRAGVYDWIPEASQNPQRYSQRSVTQMRASETTLPSLLKEAGYATCMTGKWHCNSRFNHPDQAQPGDHGFEHWFATQNNASPSHENPGNFVRNGEAVGETEGFSCNIIAAEAMSWLKQQRAEAPDQPFFIYIAFHEPHEPVASPADLVERHEANGGVRNHDEAQYFANVENVDRAVGTVVKTLEQLGVADNTLIAFTSDNGPETLSRYRGAQRSYGRPDPLRGMKLHTHEAGYRVAGIMRWPRGIVPGQVSDTPVSALDFLPTFAAIGGAEVPTDLHLDGADLRPALSGQPMERAQPLFWFYYNALNEAKVALLHDGWKILARLEDPDEPGSYLERFSHLNQANAARVKEARLTDFELYHLDEDISEERDLAADEPERLAAMHRLLDERYRDVLLTQHVWPVVDAQP